MCQSLIRGRVASSISHHAAHSAHAAHATHAAHRRRSALLRRQVADRRLRRRQQRRHGRGVDDAAAHHLRGVDHTLLEHVAVRALARRVVAVALLVLRQHLLHNDGTLNAGVRRDRAHGELQGVLHQTHTNPLVRDDRRVVEQLVQRLRGVQQRRATTRHNALRHGGTRRVQGVRDAVLLLRHLHLRRATRADHRHAAAQLGQTLLQLLPRVVAGLRVDQLLQEVAALLDRLHAAVARQHDRAVLRHRHLLRHAEHRLVEVRRVVDRRAGVLAEHRRTREDRNVLQRVRLVVTEARRLHGRDLDLAVDLVVDQGGQGLAVDVVRHDDQRLVRLRDEVQRRQDVLDVRQLLLRHEHVRVLELHTLRLRVRHEERRDEAALERHALHDVQLCLHRLAVRHRDHALLAHALHRVRDQLSDLLVAVRRDRRHLRDLLLRRDVLRLRLQRRQHLLHRQVHAALQVHRVRPRRHRLEPLLEHRARQQRRRRRAVARHVVRGVGHLAHELRAQVLEVVRELDRLRHRHTVLRDLRRAVRLLDDHVAALRAERHHNRLRQLLNAVQHRLAGLQSVLDVFAGVPASGLRGQLGSLLHFAGVWEPTGVTMKYRYCSF
eukprot:Rhum_TRINITY_DN14986_c0_g1::Rhum_TRINITY_DN14986_c0_g1_i1::g.130693::m.130693